MADYHPRIIHPDVEVAELEERLADLAEAGLTDRDRAAHQGPLERRLDTARYKQAARQRLEADAETMTPAELAAMVPR